MPTPRESPIAPLLAEEPATFPTLGMARGMVLLATLLWSLNGVFAKSTVFESWPKEETGLLLAFWRALFAGLFLLPFVRRPRLRPAYFAAGAAFAGLNATFLSSMNLTTAANAIWLQNTAPLWVFVMGRFLGSRLVPRDLVTLVFGVLGCATILWFELRDGLAGDGPIGCLLGIASGACFGLTLLLMERLRDEDPVWVVCWNHLVAATLIGIYVVPLGVWPVGTQWPTLVAFGVLQMGVPYVLFMTAMRKVPGQEAAGLCLLEPIMSPLWVWLRWGEEVQPWTIAGAGLILAGLVARYLPWPWRRPSANPAAQ